METAQKENDNTDKYVFTEKQEKLISLGLFNELLNDFKDSIKSIDNDTQKKIKKIDFYNLLISDNLLMIIDKESQDVFDLKIYEISKIIFDEIKNEKLDEVTIKSFLKEDKSVLFLIRAILKKDFDIVDFYRKNCTNIEIKEYQYLLSSALALDDVEINSYLVKNFNFKNKKTEFSLLLNSIFKFGTINQINEILKLNNDYIIDALAVLQGETDFVKAKELYFQHNNFLNKEAIYDSLGKTNIESFNMTKYLLITNILLSDEGLESRILTKIITDIFKNISFEYGNDKIIKNEKTQEMILNVFKLIFKHKNYNMEKCFIDIDKSQPNGDFLYSLLLFIGSNKIKVKPHDLDFYGKILDQYFEVMDLDDYLEGPEYNIVGSTVILTKALSDYSFEEKRNELFKFTSKILSKFPQYLNKPNPNGKLSIDLLEQKTNKRAKEINELLIKHGAVEKVPNNFWSTILKSIKKEKKEVKIEENKIEEVTNKNKSNNFIQIKNNLKKDFVDLQNYINREEIDPMIKIKCENLFLSSNKLINIITKIEHNSFFEELFFLEKNISSYLKDSIAAYYKLETLNNVEEEKINKAKTMCMTHIDLLLDQVNLVKENILSSLSEEQLLKLKVQDKFLEKKFKSSTIR